ncbi:MHC class I alpha [Labeo rohita]|nr:MHC class I alpha [Labeo rohita]
MYGCSWDEETGDVDGFDEHGYDGEDFLSLDLKNLRYITSMPQAFITQVNWNNNKALLEQKKQYRTQICIDWLKKYLQYGKSTVERKVSPQVSLLQKSPSSPVMCHATGFYPKEVTISWQKNKQDHDEDVDLGKLITNEDGTFQVMSTLSVEPEEWKKNVYECVVEHKSRTIRSILTEDKIRTNYDSTTSLPIGIIVGVVAAVLLLIVTGVAGYKVYQKKKGFKPVNASDDGSNSSAHSDPKV